MTANSADEETTETTCWEPLEGNPDCLNAVLKALGVDDWLFVDVVDVTSLPSRTAAIVLLYPTTNAAVESYIRRRQTQSPCSQHCRDDDVFFVRQRIGGSCGSIAVLHAVLNGDNVLLSLDSSFRSNLFNQFTENAMKAIQVAHQAGVAAMNHRCDPSLSPSSRAGQRQGQHFITLAYKNHELWVFDGRRDEGPINLGDSRMEAELETLIRCIEDDPAAHRFAALALATNK